MRGLAGLDRPQRPDLAIAFGAAGLRAFDFRSSSDGGSEFRPRTRSWPLCDVCRLPRSRAGRDAACSGPDFDCGLGREEAVMVAAMSLLGVPDDGSTSLSLVFGALIAGIGLVGGILWLANPDRRVSDLETIGEDDTEQNKAKAN